MPDLRGGTAQTGGVISDDPRNDVLMVALSVAVPLRIAELVALRPAEREARIGWWAREAADALAYGGDILMYGSKRSGAAARVFDHLARGLAAGALIPGGITFAGVHWCVSNSD